MLTTSYKFLQTQRILLAILFCFTFFPISLLYGQDHITKGIYNASQNIYFEDRACETMAHIESYNLYSEENIDILKSYLDTLKTTRSAPLLEARIHLTLTNYHLRKEDFNDGLQQILKVIEIANQQGEKSKEWLVVRADAHKKNRDIYYKELKSEKSLEESFKAYELYIEAQDTAKAGSMLTSIGVDYAMLSDNENAMKYINQSILLLEPLKTLEWQKWALRAKFCKGVVQFNMKKFVEAKSTLYAILPKMKELQHNNYNLALSYLGNIEQELGNYEAAIQYLNTSLEVVRAANDWNTILFTSSKLSNLHESLGQYKEAYHYSQIALAYTDSIAYKRVESKSENLQLEIEKLSEKQTIKDLEIQQKLTESKHRNKITLLTALFFVSLTSLFFWFYKRSFQQKQSLILADKETELQKVRERLLASVTHELRTPLTVVLGHIEAVRNKEHLDQEVSQSLVIAEKNAKNLLTQMNQLMDWNRLEAKAMILNNSNGNLSRWIQSIFENVKENSKTKKLQWELNITNDEVVRKLDYKKLETILKNLLTNAVKHTPTNGHIRLSMNILENNRAQIVIQDTGSGIAEDQLNHIFDWYYQAQNQQPHQAKGFGIGLALSKELVLLMKGNINIDSEVNKGTTFNLIIPFEKAISTNGVLDNSHDLKRSKQSGITSINSHKPTLLIIEDHLDLANHIKNLFKNEYQTLLTFNAKEGIEIALQETPDMIISDLMLPDQSGFDICKTLKSNILTEHIPILILTAKDTDQVKIKSLQHRADAFMGKPFNGEEIKLTIQSLLQNRQRLKLHYQKSLTTPISNETPYIDQLTNVLEKRYQENNFGVEEFAAELHMSRSQLFKKTKKVLDSTPGQMIKQFRLEKARKLLQEKDIMISEVSFVCGFSSPEYFSTVYKEHFKISPTSEKNGK